MEENHVSYYAIIPANVRYDEDLTPNAKLLYGEITALCNMKGYCWASNSYFASLYKVSTVSISKWVKQLIEKGYIESVMKYREGTKEIEYRYLTIVQGGIKEKLNTYETNVKEGIKEKLNTPIKEKFKDNNTLINNTNNIKDMVDSEKSTVSLIDEQFEEWWNIYGRKVQKPKALTAFTKVVKKHTYEQLKKDTEIYIGNYTGDPKFKPYPATFLNGYNPDDERFNNNLYLDNTTNAHQGVSQYKPINEKDLFRDS